MKFGLFSINNFACSYPETLASVAKAAEDAGFESLWTGEHVVLPDPQVPPSPVPPDGRMLDPNVALGFIAAHTSRVKLGTGIIILPQRNPVVLAKELASVDVLSGGRLLFGLGVGYLEPEFTAIGVPMADRGARSLEYVEAMRALWESDKPEYSGKYVSFSGVDAHPRPIQRPVPVIMAGHSAPAYRRTVTHGHGWYGFALDVDATRTCIEGLRAAESRYERCTGAGDIEITVTPRRRVDAAAVEQFAALGVDRLVLQHKNQDEDEVLRFIDETATTLLP